MPPVIAGRSLKVDLTELRGKLNLLGRRMGNNVVRRGILAGMGVVREEVRTRVPQPKGKKKRSKKAAKGAKPKGPARLPTGEYPVGAWATGLLKKSIASDTKVVVDDKRIPVQITGRVFVKKPKNSSGRNPRRYAHLVEYGVAPHHVGKGAVGAKKAAARNKKVVEVGVKHPGHKARPFMRPGWDAKAAEAATTIERVTREQLNLELTKIGKKVAG